MAEEPKKEIELKIGHVLFIDIVGYSQLLITQQGELLSELNEVVSSTNHFAQAYITNCNAQSYGHQRRYLTSGKTNVGQALVLRAVFTLVIFCP